MKFVIAVPFDATLFVETEVLGARIPISLASTEAILELPGAPPITAEGRSLLSPPSQAMEGLGRFLPDEIWGLQHVGQPGTGVEALLVAVEIEVDISFDISGKQLGGPEARRLIDEVSTWFRSFQDWLWVLTSQSLHPLYPDPKTISRRSNHLVAAVSDGSQESMPSAESPPLILTIDSGSPASERRANLRVLQIAAAEAGGTSPPLALELLATARILSCRGDDRRALIDAGTAAESALTHVLGLKTGHRKTLGPLVAMAKTRGIAIPSDSTINLVRPRNAAAHSGVNVSRADAARAIEIAETIVSLTDRVTFRPQA